MVKLSLSEPTNWRLIAIVFAIVLLQNLPGGQLPTVTDLYKAVVLAAIAALLLLQKGEGGGAGTNIPVRR